MTITSVNRNQNTVLLKTVTNARSAASSAFKLILKGVLIIMAIIFAIGILATVIHGANQTDEDTGAAAVVVSSTMP